MRRRPDTLFTPAFVALTVSDLAYCTATGALLGVTPFFVTGPLDGGPAAVGVAVGASGVTTLVLRPLAGRWADRHGRRPLLVGGASLLAVLVLGHLLVTDLAWLVVLRLLLGAAEALYVVAGFAALADLAPAGRAGEALSYNSLALYVGIAVGPVVGQALLGSGGFAAVWAGGAVLLAVAALLAARVPETLEPVSGPSAAPPLLHPAVLLPGIGLLAGVAVVGGFTAFAPLHAARIGLDAWSTVLGLFGLVVVVCRTVFATLPDRVPPLRLAAAALGASAAGLTLVAAVPSAEGLLAGTASLAVGTAFLTPAVFAAVFSRVPPSQRGSAAGTASVFIDLGLGGGPLLLGLVASAGGIPAAFLTAAGLAAGGAVLLASRPVAGARPDPRELR
ncbi:Predicted arabinose efflux permease, MFS family [Geodermatophilus telluris]|uniref:Predicted arabinose efflux permease, MFS family n=1 Tax=Geodermatophilus telluris TaxID=1190417 RepID=A0A1G6JXD0_9ACTN|nr:MFS transporter [Geodermatophilus telluris]SDC23439.1 Predicted arabinose efflux permease, MFS family [Geodermatophilus telluris]